MVNRLALLWSAVLAAFGAALLLFYMQRFERETSGGANVEVLTVSSVVERGRVLTDAVLATRMVPMAYVEDRAVRALDRTKIIGVPLTVSLTPGQVLMWTDLAVTPGERELSSLVQLGRRAITVLAAGSRDVAGQTLARPGDYVDVIVTTPASPTDERLSATVLLQRVLVLAVGRDLGAPEGTHPGGLPQRSDEKPMTLSLTLSEAQLVALAIERGHLSVAVRNVQDPSVQSDIPDMPETAILNPQQRAAVVSHAHVSPTPVAIGAVP